MSIKIFFNNLLIKLNPSGAFTGVHPGEILSAVKSAADRQKKIFKTKTIVPDTYTVMLSARDFEAIKPFLHELQSELSQELKSLFSRRNWIIQSRKIRLQFEARRIVKPGDIQITGYFGTDDGASGGSSSELPAEPVQLKFSPGSADEKVVTLEPGSYIIGRGQEADVAMPVEDMLASRKHCRLAIEENRMSICDLDSANGTFLNQNRITGPESVHPGDRFRIGKTEIEVLRCKSDG